MRNLFRGEPDGGGGLGVGVGVIWELWISVGLYERD